MDKRLMKLLSTRGKEIKGGQMLDTYNQQIQEEVSCTIRTNINTANHHFVVEEPIIVAMRGREPQVLTPKRTEFGKAVRKQYENKELKMSRHTMQQLEPRKDGVTNTLTSVQKDNLVAEPLHIPEATAQGCAEANTLDCGCQQGVVVSEGCIQIGNILPDTPNMTNRSSGRDYSNEGCSPSILSRDFKQPKMVDDTSCRYRIRKLTPRECFRLMGVDDKDIDKIQASGISNSQQYKCAGNSIVVDVLYHIFRKMFVETENEQQQMTLF